jgi:YD repeat-containing protein
VDSVAGTISRTFDLLDRLTEEETPEGTVDYTYDDAGRRSSMTVAGQTAVSYAYDNADRLTGITQGSASVAFAYDAANRRTSLTLPNGIVIESAYDDDSQLTGLTYKLSGSTIGDLTYGYDASGWAAGRTETDERRPILGFLGDVISTAVLDSALGSRIQGDPVRWSACRSSSLAPPTRSCWNGRAR